MSEKNKHGYLRSEYVGAPSTLCQGCGHDSVTQHLISSLFGSRVHPFKMVKMSGIGCSSKTPAYFLNQSHGFNSLHGRMAPVATGAKVANRDLHIVGISGDGDTASIGLGGFSHLLRRNLPMVYIVENNGVYGLTKGQFSATADEGSLQKSGDANPFQTIDLCGLAIELGCGFVARSFSGDSKQLVPLISAAMEFPGTSFIDVISPCITFANHTGSTKSYTFVREHKQALQELGYIEPEAELQVDYQPGEVVKVDWPSGGVLWLKKINENGYDVFDRSAALGAIHSSQKDGHILTGLLHLNMNQKDLIKKLELPSQPLTGLEEKDIRPSPQILTEILSAFK